MSIIDVYEAIRSSERPLISLEVSALTNLGYTQTKQCLNRLVENEFLYTDGAMHPTRYGNAEICDERDAPVLIVLRCGRKPKTVADLAVAANKSIEAIQISLERLIQHDLVDYKLLANGDHNYFAVETATWELPE